MENPVYSQNYRLIKERWPLIMNYLEALDEEINVTLLQGGIQQTLLYKQCHLSSCYNREKEAQVQNSTIPLTSEQAHLYGVGLGDGIKDLVQRTQLKKIDVLLLSPLVFYIYINFFDASDWLESPKVHLHLAQGNKLKFPYAVNTAELHFAEEQALEIKNLILIDRNLNHEEQHHTHRLAEVYKKNVSNNKEFTNKDQYIETLKNKHKDKAFLLLSGGPTATEQLKAIRQQKDSYIIIAASTAIIPLEMEGIIPDYVVAIDPMPELARHFDTSNKELYKEKILVYSPTTSYDAVKAWPGQRKICLTRNNSMLKKQVLMQPLSVLFSGGSIAHTITDLAVQLGAKKITLVGFDFCFPNEKSHLDYNPMHFQIIDRSCVTTINGYNKKVPSYLNLLSYKKTLEDFIESNPSVIFYNTGKEGATIKGAAWTDL